ncbi:phage holin family protein [Chromobacterium sp. IIBBL 290-4]|uniref:phage holin family protein n=1 Tax=Chromobacterium sp. IIBBL 290-4 TaxID=2953890 RepID=UPI0020B66E24|nr:phage holin family protein [Chromobacterium sp. IIBBL 290-4]UTH72633.1 phage holin family protein [Chromobacterium sp. IIBBL 290-4]
MRSFAGGVAALLFTRAELLSLEAQELKDDIVGNLLQGMLGLVLLGCGLIAAVLALWALTPAAWRLAVMAALALLLCGASAFLLLGLRRKLREQPAPFATTLEEVRKDWTALGPGGERP